ncbi:MAG: DUF1820 family protein [Deltaproteobacteria bacterium]|nr:DUF1820 family protein [Deltaproteobacteria bacterium]
MKTREKRDKTYFRITFTNETSQEEELYQVSARNVSASDMYGLVEISEFIFPENKLIHSPGEERIRREFQSINRTWIPYHAIIRIDEINDSTVTELKVVGFDSQRRGSKEITPPLKKS